MKLVSLNYNESAALWSTQIAPYGQIDIKELTTYPDLHKGEKVVIKGYVFNLIKTREFQVMVSWRYPVYVEAALPIRELYDDDQVTVYGTIAGEACGYNPNGVRLCQPYLIDAFFVKW